jgi:hypothetical protein
MQLGGGMADAELEDPRLTESCKVGAGGAAGEGVERRMVSSSSSLLPPIGQWALVPFPPRGVGLVL